MEVIHKRLNYTISCQVRKIGGAVDNSDFFQIFDLVKNLLTKNSSPLA